MLSKPRFEIGTKFVRAHRKKQDLETVVDILTTTNNAGEVVNIRYVATHLFCGQTVTDYDVLDTTIARGLMPQNDMETVNTTK